jgi:hypothetical protein
MLFQYTHNREREKSFFLKEKKKLRACAFYYLSSELDSYFKVGPQVPWYNTDNKHIYIIYQACVIVINIQSSNTQIDCTSQYIGLRNE